MRKEQKLPLKKLSLIALILTQVLLVSCNQEVRRIEGQTMGTYYRVLYYGNNDYSKEIEKRLIELNNIYSTYISNSELSKINSSIQTEFPLSTELAEVLQASQKIHYESKAALEVTLAPVISLWGFGPEGITKRPQPEKLKELAQLVGTEKIDIQGNRLIRPVGLRIDLSALAKGHGVDQIAKFLQSQKIDNFLVEIGGEIRAQGQKEDESKWRVGIEAPKKMAREIKRVIELENLSIATSGSYRNFRKYGVKEYTHIINPLTLQPIENKVVSVSVLHPSCMIADAWATALMVLGPKNGIDLANEYRLPALFMLDSNNNEVKAITSNLWPKN